MLGLHMYCVAQSRDIEFEDKPFDPDTSFEGFIVSISDGETMSRQFGPKLSTGDFKEIQHPFNY